MNYEFVLINFKQTSTKIWLIFIGYKKLYRLGPVRTGPKISDRRPRGPVPRPIQDRSLLGPIQPYLQTKVTGMHIILLFIKNLLIIVRVGSVLAKTGPVSVLEPVLPVFGPRFQDRSGPVLIYNFLYPIKMSQIFVLIYLKLIRTNS